MKSHLQITRVLLLSPKGGLCPPTPAPSALYGVVDVTGTCSSVHEGTGGILWQCQGCWPWCMLHSTEGQHHPRANQRGI